MELRQLTTIEDYGRVSALERTIWGYASAEETVPVPIMIVTQKIGGLLLGAFDEAGALVGFAYSLPGVRQGRPFQWSHTLGVAAGHRDRGLGFRLKVEQRRLTLAMGIDLVEWTFDPLQALNAHLNFAKLGAVARDYQPNVYGESSSTLHRGTPTDRFVAEWWVRSPKVEQRLRDVADGATRRPPLDDAAPVNGADDGRQWPAPPRADLSLQAERLAVTIPTGFTELQQQDVSLAAAWRASTREIFATYLARGYVVTDFALQRERGRGVYVLEKSGPSERAAPHLRLSRERDGAVRAGGSRAVSVPKA